MDPAAWAAVGAIGGSMVAGIAAVAVEVVRRRREAAHPPPSLSQTSIPPPLSGRPTRARVLVVEDDHLNAKLTARILSGLNIGTQEMPVRCVVDVAESCAEARALADAGHTWRVVVVDLRLPDGAGDDLAVELAERQRLRTLAYSGLDDAARRASVKGLDAVLEKGVRPTMVTDLEEAVRALLR